VLERAQPCEARFDALLEMVQIASNAIADGPVACGKPIQGARSLLRSAKGIAPQGFNGVL
jgi:hypothetical protein